MTFVYKNKVETWRKNQITVEVIRKQEVLKLFVKFGRIGSIMQSAQKKPIHGKY